MEQRTEPLTPTQVVIDRMTDLRKRRGWSAAELARRMQAAGIPWERIVVTKLETGRRASVSVAELLALAAVLNVAPVVLLTPDDDRAPYRVTATETETAFAVRAWIRGVGPLGDADPREYYAELPRGEFYMPAHMDPDGTVHGAVQQGPPRRPSGSGGSDQDA